jgi:hypothetical protein
MAGNGGFAMAEKRPRKNEELPDGFDVALAHLGSLHRHEPYGLRRQRV